MVLTAVEDPGLQRFGRDTLRGHQHEWSAIEYQGAAQAIHNRLATRPTPLDGHCKPGSMMRYCCHTMCPGTCTVPQRSDLQVVDFESYVSVQQLWCGTYVAGPSRANFTAHTYWPVMGMSLQPKVTANVYPQLSDATFNHCKGCSRS